MTPWTSRDTRYVALVFLLLLSGIVMPTGAWIVLACLFCNWLLRRLYRADIARMQRRRLIIGDRHAIDEGEE